MVIVQELVSHQLPASASPLIWKKQAAERGLCDFMYPTLLINFSLHCFVRIASVFLVPVTGPDKW